MNNDENSDIVFSLMLNTIIKSEIEGYVSVLYSEVFYSFTCYRLTVENSIP